MKTVIKRKAKNGDHYDMIIIESYLVPPEGVPEGVSEKFQVNPSESFKLASEKPQVKPSENFKLEFRLPSYRDIVFDSLDELEAHLRDGDLWKELQLNLSKK